MKDELLKLFAEKKEIVTDFPRWMLPPETESRLRLEKGKAIAEIAGRDSIAAVIKVCDAMPIKSILPVIAYTGTEYGSWDIPLRAVEEMGGIMSSKGIAVYDPLFVGSPTFWHGLCGKPAYSMLEEFGFTTPCIGCHLYFHAVRIPLALKLECRYIIAGERESHDGRLKINQLATVLDFFEDFCRSFSVELLLPLRKITAGPEIERILGRNWQEGKEQLKCVLSGNYLDRHGNLNYDEMEIRKYMEEFLLPMAKELLIPYINRI